MKKLLFLTATTTLFVCLMCTSYAELAGEMFNITTINVCYGDILVEVRSENDSVGYEIVNCTFGEDFWVCKCNNPLTLYLKTDENVSNVYDVFVQYWVHPLLEVVKNDTRTTPTFEEIENDSNKRTRSFNNIRFGPSPPPPPPPKKPVELPEISSLKMVFLIVGFILLFVIVLCYVTWKWVAKDVEDLQ